MTYGSNKNFENDTSVYPRLRGDFEKEPYSELGPYQELVQEENKSGVQNLRGRLL